MSALDEYITSSPGRSKWRRRARAAIAHAVESYRNINVDIDRDELIRLVDAAYPFGERAWTPYKAWLLERKRFIAALDAAPGPTDEDRAAWDVANDLVEMERYEEARALLEQQAPRRLNRRCPVCAADIGSQCLEPLGMGGDRSMWMPRVLPHRARMEQPE